MNFKADAAARLPRQPPFHLEERDKQASQSYLERGLGGTPVLHWEREPTHG